MKQNEENEIKLKCLKQTLWHELPIRKVEGSETAADWVHAHHGDAGHHSTWNSAMSNRFKALV